MAKLPLEGIRVLENTVVWAGPYATHLLADWGAEVIRIESTQHWQFNTRSTPVARPKKSQVGPHLGTPWGRGYPNWDPGERPWNRYPWFNAHARNKLSMTVDLTRPEGLDIFMRLARVSDVFISNNALGVVEKLNTTYEDVKKVNPNIIYVSMPPFGLTGPYRSYRTLGLNLDYYCGHTWIREYPDEDPSRKSLTNFPDATGSANAAFAILMALHYRDRTGEGQFIEVAQVETIIPLIAEAVMDYSMNERVHGPLGNRDIHGAAPCGCYPCQSEPERRCTAYPAEVPAGEDRWINITIRSDEEWQRLCQVMGNPAWAKDEKFSNALSRYNNQDELDKLVSQWTSQHEPYTLMYLLQNQGIAAGPVMDDKDDYNDIHLKERGFFEPLTQADCGTHLYPGLDFKLSKTPNHLRTPPCLLGEHNEYVYKQVIGVSDEEYARLEADGHIGTEYIPEIP